MKKLLFFVVLLGILSCEDVVDVDLNTAPPRLVIQAHIMKWDNGNGLAKVRLTTTAPFFDNEVPIVTDAQVMVTDSNGREFIFTYSENGYYLANLLPEANMVYTLKIKYNDEVYTASEKLYSVVPLEYVEQRNDGGFTGEDIELKAFFTDPAQERNFYFFEGLSEKGDVMNVYNDEFFDGNLIFGFYWVEDLEPLDRVQFNLYGVSEAYYNYMYVLLQQTSDQGGGPFETQPATVRGNIVNQTKPENYPLGYFRISEVSTLNYTVQ